MLTPSFTLGVLVAAPLAVSQLRVRLFTAPVLAEAGFVEIGNLVEPTTAGYEPSPAASWKDPEVPDVHLVKRTTLGLDFRATGPSPGTMVRGYFVTIFDGVNTLLLDAVEFPNPKPFAAAGDNVALQVTVTVYDSSAFAGN